MMLCAKPAPAHGALKRGRLLLICALSILCLSQAATAQSGRRNVRQNSPAPAAPAETSAEPAAAPTRPAPPVASLIVGGSKFSSSVALASGYLDQAIGACLDQLRKSASLEVRGGGDMTRKEAIDRAKKQTEAHVVWLELSADDFGRSAGGGQVTIEYVVFSPQTAKVKTFGRVYLDGTRMGNRRVGVGVPSINGRLPLQYLLREGGREVAERLMNAFHVSATN